MPLLLSFITNITTTINRRTAVVCVSRSPSHPRSRGDGQLWSFTMSETVKVLYKGPDGLPVVKDLDTDILAKDPSRCTRAHWVASTIIRQLRQKDIHKCL